MLFFFDKKNILRNLAKAFAYAGSGIIVFSALSFILKDFFSAAFIRFHELFFSNDLWILNPATDKLIVLYPEQFFVDFVTAVYVRSLLISLFLFLCITIIHMIYKRHGRIPSD